MDNKKEQPLSEKSTLPDNHPLENVNFESYEVFDKTVLLNHTDGIVCVYHGGILGEQIAEVKNFTRCDVARYSKEGLICTIQVYYGDPEWDDDKILHIDENGEVSFLDTPLPILFIPESLEYHTLNPETDINLF